jgi:DNA-binding LacI/PurR family transcriptional regulator
LRIPEDVAVIGCDDSPVAALFQPSLTSVRAPWTSLAEPLRKLLSGELVTGSGKWHDLRVVPRSSA